MKLKKLLSIGLVIAMATSLMVGCGSNGTDTSADKTEDSGDKAENTSDSVKTVTIGDYTFTIDTAKDPKDIEIPVVYQNVQDIFASYMEEGVLGFADTVGINAYVTGSNDWSAESQYNLMETLVTKLSLIHISIKFCSLISAR